MSFVGSGSQLGRAYGKAAGVALLCALALSACSEAQDSNHGFVPMGIGTGAGTGGVTGGAAAAPSLAGTGGTGAAGTAAPAGGTGGMTAPPLAGTGAPGGAGGMSAPAGTGGMDAPPAGGSDAGTPEVPDASGPEPDAMVTPEDLGMGDGSDVITIGDSWMNLGLEGIQQSLLRASGQRYRTYAQPGTRMLTGAIPGQYDSAKRADPDIKTVVMTGGGNDVLLTGLSGACASGTPACLTRLEEITAAFNTLWGRMAADGVRDLILIHYASDAGDGLHESLMHIERLMTACGAVPAPMRCHLMLTDDIVMGQYRDGVHPTGAAYDRLGKAAYDLMVAEGMRR